MDSMGALGDTAATEKGMGSFRDCQWDNLKAQVAPFGGLLAFLLSYNENPRIAERGHVRCHALPTGSECACAGIIATLGAATTAGKRCVSIRDVYFGEREGECGAWCGTRF